MTTIDSCLSAVENRRDVHKKSRELVHTKLHYTPGHQLCCLTMSLTEPNLNDKVGHLVTNMDGTPRMFRVQCFLLSKEYKFLLKREYGIEKEHGLYLAVPVGKGNKNRVCMIESTKNVYELHVTLLSE